MTRQILGSGNSERPPTMTLKQFVEADPTHVPNVSRVRIVFAPSKVPNWSLITDHDFRVNVHRTSPLFGLFNESIADWCEEGVVLSVLPSAENPGEFAIAIDGDRKCDWERADWGYKLGQDSPRPNPIAQNQPAGQRRRAADKA